jgi:hypothetical protein
VEHVTVDQQKLTLIACKDSPIAQRTFAGDRNEMAGLQGAARRLRESITLMRRLWTEERVTFKGKVLLHSGSHDLRPPGEAGADMDRSLGPDRSGDGR